MLTEREQFKSITKLTALGYIGVRSAGLDDWGSYATRLPGMRRPTAELRRRRVRYTKV